MPLFNMLANQWLGGSEKIKKNAKGLLSDIKDAPRQVGLLFDPKFQKGLLDQMSVTDKIDKDKAVATALEATGMAPMGLAGHIVYHGSPHKFDKFDMSKIGTGEGAQAYGHGLYFAEAPEVATDYATKLSSAGLAKNKLAQNGGDIDAAITAANERIENYKNLIANGGGGDPRRAQGMLNLAEKDLNDLLAMKSGTLNEAGNLYKVDIPDEAIPRMLDWDKPLTEQPESIRSALNNLVQTKRAGDLFNPTTGKFPMNKGYKPATGKDAIEMLNASVRGNVRAEELMREYGIPGIRYLDQASRDLGQGTSNYVLFDDQLARILEINGQPTGLLPWGK